MPETRSIEIGCPAPRPRNPVSHPQIRSSNLENTLEKINREIMVGQQTFSILLAVLLLLVLTGIGGGAYVASGDDVCHNDNDCHEVEPKRHKPHRRILKHGSRGEDVKRLQKVLLARGFCPRSFVPDGIFGPTTQKAVKQFQRQANLRADGVVGPETWDRIFASS
ncbi:MAG: peptidoglycan-binding domain-containing protein [Microcoleus sp.]